MKKPLVIGIAVLVLAAAGGGGYYLWSRTKSAAPPTVVPGESQVSPTDTPVETTLWSDPAGFRFKYPKDLSVNKNENDQVNYAHVELTNAKYPGHIIVWAKDTTAKDAAGWVKSDKSFAGANVLDSSLSEMPAKKVLLTGPTGKTMFVGTISEGLLFLIEGTSDEGGYWSKTYDVITSSFEFTPETTDGGGAAAAGGSEEVADEEEWVE